MEASDGNYGEVAISLAGDVAFFTGFGAVAKGTQGTVLAGRLAKTTIVIEGSIAGYRGVQGGIEIYNGDTSDGVAHIGEATLLLLGIGVQKYLDKRAIKKAAEKADDVFRAGDNALGKTLHPHDLNFTGPREFAGPHRALKSKKILVGKSAYETARSGGKHAGFLKNYLNKSPVQILKGIKSLKKIIAEHRDKIVHPEKYISDFYKLDPRQQHALLNKEWPSQILRQSEQLNILENLLRILGG